MKYLVVVEVSQKQHYIFKTDRLAQNIGASIAVRKLTEEVPRKYLGNGSPVYAGGGNSVFEFEKEEDARSFISRVSEEALVKYPGVEMFLAMQGYEEESEAVAKAIDELFSKLEQKKSLRESTFTVHGLGIERKCAMTQMPACVYDETDGEYHSREADVKNRLALEETTESYKDLLPETESGETYRFAKRFEELGGSKGEKNYVAVVAIDGNRMGKKIKKFREDFEKNSGGTSSTANNNYKAGFKELSEGIEDIYRTAIRKMMSDLAVKLPELIENKVINDNGRDKDGSIILPIRPLIMAGDDICFVTDSRIGLSLAEKALRYIEEQKLEKYDFDFKACAGVAFTKTSYPFFRTHELAEELCSNAKSIIREEDDDCSVIDFHIVQGEIEGSLSEIRRDKYNKGTLTNKPYYLNAGSDNKNNMQFFKNRINKFRNAGFGKGVLKEYRTALKEGEDKSKEYIGFRRLKDIIGESHECGSDGKIHCTDFDVIEMLDIFYDLSEETKE